MRKSGITLHFIFIFSAFIFSNCNQPAVDKNANVKKPERVRVKPALTGYHIEKVKERLKRTDSLPHVLLTVNRTDSNNFKRLDSVIVPNDMTGDIEFYLPFPFSVPYIKDVKKIIFFSYPTQSFGAYESGELVYTGATSMGSRIHPTPTGLYYTNWKAEKTTSTFNDEWDLRWNFNIENKLGIGFHQYEQPGYPASHSCLRLQEKDARYLYDWAEQWILDKKNEDSLLAKGTPVIVFGSYSFDAPKPWLRLITDPHVLDISAASIQQETASYLPDILAQQQKRIAVQSASVKK